MDGAGRPSLVASFLAPRWVLQLEPVEARVSLEIQSTPRTASKVMPLLGVNLVLFQIILG